MTALITLYQPQNVSLASSNGGRMTANPVVLTGGGSGNFPYIDEDVRAAGATWHRKLFAKVLNVTTSATKAIIVMKKTASADTRAYMIAGTQRDQQSAIGTRKYATGNLNTAVGSAETALIVDFEVGQGAANVVQAGDKLAIFEGATKSLELLVDSVVWTGNQAAITLNALTPTTASFSTSAFVGSCIVDTTNINPRFDNVVKSFVGSTYDETTYPILLDRVATDEQTITITFINATQFSVLSDIHGALPNGSVSADYIPNNANFSLPYLTLQSAGWGGTHTAGESLQLQIHPAAVAVWIGYVISAGAAVSPESIPVNIWLDSY